MSSTKFELWAHFYFAAQKLESKTLKKGIHAASYELCGARIFIWMYGLINVLMNNPNGA